jgi:hypothetical protein
MRQCLVLQAKFEVPSAPSLDPLHSGAQDTEHQTLTEIEALVESPHVTDSHKVDDARDEVSKALLGSEPSAPMPIQALNAQPFGDALHPPVTDQPNTLPSVEQSMPVNTPQVTDSTAPPPVPPPLPFQFNTPPR